MWQDESWETTSMCSKGSSIVAMVKAEAVDKGKDITLEIFLEELDEVD